MRRLIPLLIALVAALSTAFAATPALAHGPHGYGPRVHFGFMFGGPAYYPDPWYYPPYPPAVVYPPAVYVPPEPQTYIERSDAPGDDAQNYWYWCADAKAYYPYVKQCPGGWQTVTPRQPAG